MNDDTNAAGVFLRALAPMLDAGEPLLASLRELASRQSDASMQKTIEQIAVEVENGTQFSSALAARPKVFDQNYVGLLQVFESAALKACKP